MAITCSTMEQFQWDSSLRNRGIPEDDLLAEDHTIKINCNLETNRYHKYVKI